MVHTMYKYSTVSKTEKRIKFTYVLSICSRQFKYFNQKIPRREIFTTCQKLKLDFPEPSSFLAIFFALINKKKCCFKA